MIRSIGTVFLLGLLQLSPVNDSLEYSYKAHFSNDNVIYTQINDVIADGIEHYNFTFSLAVDFDVYFNQDSQEFYTTNYIFNSVVSRYDYYSDTLYKTVNLLYTSNFNLYSYELDDSSFDIIWVLPHENDIVRLGISLNDSAMHYETEQITLNEDFNDDYQLSYSLDLSQLSTEIYNFTSMSKSYNQGYTDGSRYGYDVGKDEGITQGYQSGYADGYNEASTQNQTAVTIFSGIISVALIPINFFLACLNFEVFGINIGSFVSALLTVAIVVIITRMIVSGGNGGGDK